MGYCPYCNAYVQEGTNYCYNCGQMSQLVRGGGQDYYTYEPSTPYPSYQPPQQPYYSQYPQTPYSPYQQPYYPYPSQYMDPDKKVGDTLGIIGLVFGILGFLIFGLIFGIIAIILGIIAITKRSGWGWGALCIGIIDVIFAIIFALLIISLV